LATYVVGISALIYPIKNIAQQARPKKISLEIVLENKDFIESYKVVNPTMQISETIYKTNT
jgi:5-bromo-4-chloroindolyl phosphate hydrolysis protein